MGTGALLKVKRGQGRESTFYGGSVHLTKASQKNLTLARKKTLDKQNDKGNVSMKQFLNEVCHIGTAACNGEKTAKGFCACA